MQLGTVSGHEDPAIPVTSVQDNGPTQSSLRGFEHKELEVFPVIVNRYAPFPIVIFEH